MGLPNRFRVLWQLFLLKKFVELCSDVNYIFSLVCFHYISKFANWIVIALLLHVLVDSETPPVHLFLETLQVNLVILLLTCQDGFESFMFRRSKDGTNKEKRVVHWFRLILIQLWFQVSSQAVENQKNVSLSESNDFTMYSIPIWTIKCYLTGLNELLFTCSC